MDNNVLRLKLLMLFCLASIFLAAVLLMLPAFGVNTTQREVNAMFVLIFVNVILFVGNIIFDIFFCKCFGNHK